MPTEDELEQPEPSLEAASDERPEPGEQAGIESDEHASPERDPSDEREMRLLDRLERMERSLAEAHDTITRVTSRDRGAPVDDDGDAPPEKVETWEDMQRYLDFRDRRLAKELRGVVSADAGAIASEQRARGLYNREAMGVGHDYDSLVARHIEPQERTDPAFRRLLQGQRDPATARYALALVMEMVDRAKGDPAKGFASVWAAIDGKRSTTRDVVSKIRKAAEKQVDRSNLRGAAPGNGATKMPSAEELKNLPTSEFIKRYPNAAY